MAYLERDLVSCFMTHVEEVELFIYVGGVVVLNELVLQGRGGG